MRATPVQEDYLEVIYRLGAAGGGARTTDIAFALGCRLPTVSRSVRKMAAMGLVRHETRGLIGLTGKGRATAENIAHRHADTVDFLVRVLGLTRRQAETDACKVEHGLSPLAAQRLHDFLEYVDRLEPSARKVIMGFARRASTTHTDFRFLSTGKGVGWRR